MPLNGAVSEVFWDPKTSKVEGDPSRLDSSHLHPAVMAQPHWHAHIELNFLVGGTLGYVIDGQTLALGGGEFLLFWAGVPHQVVSAANDADYVVVHLPLRYFFSLQLPPALLAQLMRGCVLLAGPTDPADRLDMPRISGNIQFGDGFRRDHAVRELLLRITRLQFEPFRLVTPSGGVVRDDGLSAARPPRNFDTICDFLSKNFRDEIDSADIAASAHLHPKYAMSAFKQSTGMTLNEFLNLLRLSYAQAQLVTGDAKVLTIAMESGFGSLSAFNKAFRRLAGMSPTQYRRVSR